MGCEHLDALRDHERWLLQQIHQLRLRQQQEMEPWIQELVRVRSVMPTSPVMLTVQALKDAGAFLDVKTIYPAMET